MGVKWVAQVAECKGNDSAFGFLVMRWRLERPYDVPASASILLIGPTLTVCQYLNVFVS